MKEKKKLEEPTSAGRVLCCGLCISSQSSRFVELKLVLLVVHIMDALICVCVLVAIAGSPKGYGSNALRD